MIQPRPVTLFFAPTKQYVAARIESLSQKMIEEEIHRDWWNDPALVDKFVPPPIDLHWNWTEFDIEQDGRKLASEKVAVVTGDGLVQGAMLISTDPVPSSLSVSSGALFIELLFTAPRNRPALRTDNKAFYAGVGSQLLTWGAWLSREKGLGGRLKLDGSPEFVIWYEKRGLKKLATKPIVFEDTEYTPMELTSDAAARLIEAWE